MALLCRTSNIISCARFARSYRQCSFPTIPMLQSATVSPKRLYSSEKDKGESNKEVVPNSVSKPMSGGNPLAELAKIRVTTLQKYALVWQGKYKSVAEVPTFVSLKKMDGAMNRARIKINLMMIAATILGCILMIVLGKKAQKEGKSIVKMNQDWHKKIKEEGK